MDDELINEFVNESREHLSTIETDLLTIEEGGENVDHDLVNKVFRAAHSIKGGSAFFGFTKVKELAHRAETVLDMLRSDQMTPNAEITNVLLAAFDKLREMINNPELRDTADTSELLVALTGLASSYLPQEAKAALSQDETFPVEGGAALLLPKVDVDRVRASGKYLYCASLDLIHDIERKGRNVLAVFREVWETGEILDCSMDFESVGTLDDTVGNRLPLRLVFATIIAPEDLDVVIVVAPGNLKVLVDPRLAPAPAPARPAPPVSVAPEPVATPAMAPVEEPAPEPVRPAPVAPKAPKAESGGDHGSSQATAESTLRVQVGLLETLMNLAGELVLSRNQLRAAISQDDSRSLSVADQRINQVTSELQDAIMQTRLQPVGNVFGKFPRVVRDLANALGKDIDLDIRGRDVALDKSLIEGLSDPLTHMVRNAVDHGIESPDIRQRGGKRAKGTIRIEARHEAGQVVVEIADDGKGIDPGRIAKSALTKGLITADRLKAMSEQDVLALIFLPGLSTAEKVTEVSGRGVGMDVVKTNLDRLGGKVEIKSQVGKGTLFRIKLPLTLAIIPSLIVSVGHERFAIPQINVEELLRIRAEDVKKRLDVVGGAEVLLLRDRILPLLRFSELIGDGGATQGTGKGALEIVVVTTGSLSYGLVVGAFHDTEEIVVKPLGRHLKGLAEYAGATILGDGMVALILDVGGLAGKAQLTAVSAAARAAEQAEGGGQGRVDEVHSLLLFHNAPDELCGTPLDTVQRIERIRPEQVETKGGRRTMQYRGAALPLVTLADVAPVQSIGDSNDLAVIVTTVHGREVGLLGAMPVDVIETKAVIDRSTHRQRGVAGSTIIGGRTALLTDLVEIVDSVYPDWGMQAPPVSSSSPSSSASGLGSGKPGILLAEDSDFFRAQVKRYLEEDGELVFDAPDGQAAWETLLQHIDEVKAVVTDVEMPRLTGLELAQRIRSDARTAGLPVIGLSSLAGEDDIARGKAAGFTDYQVKLDRDRLVSRVREYLGESANGNGNGNEG